MSIPTIKSNGKSQNEHGFSEDRVIKASDKLKNLNSSQGSLDAWF